LRENLGLKPAVNRYAKTESSGTQSSR
jgi:hypothetical protein